MAFSYMGFHPYINENWVVVRNYNEFILAIDKYKDNINIISFDHDLGCDDYGLCNNGFYTKTFWDETSYDKTGYDCAKYIVENDINFSVHLCHSQNPVGKKNIESLLSNYLKHKNGK